MPDTKLIHADLTYAIRGVLFDVGNHLVPRLPEAHYQEAVCVGLERRNIRVSREVEFNVVYRDIEVGRYYCDLLVADTVVVELKVAPALADLHRAQLFSYLRVTGADVGLLVNYGTPKVDIERYASSLARARLEFV